MLADSVFRRRFGRQLLALRLADARVGTGRGRAFDAPARYCTFAVTDALLFNVKVHVFCLLPPLEHAPDQIASRSFVTLSVIRVPVANDAEPVLPTLTLMPAGLELTRSPLRPVAETVSVTVCAAGLTVNVAVRVRSA